jgi:hypothetical protein
MTYSALEHLDDLEHLVARCRPDPKAAQCVAVAEAARDSLKAKVDDWTNQSYLAVEAQSAVVLAEENLNNMIRTARSVLLDDVGYKRRSTKLLTHMPRGLTAMFRLRLLDRLAVARALAEKCAQDPNAKVQAAAGSLSASVDEMMAALQRRQDATVAEDVAYGHLQAEKVNAINVCKHIAHTLEELYPEDPDRVRGYFRQSNLTRPAPRDSNETVPGTEPDPGPNPGEVPQTPAQEKAA